MKGLVKGNPTGFRSNFVCTIINYSIDEGNKGRVIPIVFSPESLSDTISANFTQTTIPGASAPQITYTATGARTVSFSLSLPSDYLPPNSEYRNFEEYLNAFRALVYPKYTKSGKVKSPHVKLTTSNIDIDGVCTQCSIEYRNDQVKSDGSMSANISLAFLEVIDNVGKYDAEFVANSSVKLSGTVLTVSSGEVVFNTPSSSAYQDDGKCYITLNGSSDVTVNSPVWSILDTVNRGIWSDPGCNHTRKDKYTVKRFCGFVTEATASISNIEISNKNGLTSGTCISNGNKVSLSTSLLNGSAYGGQETITYFLVYVPVYDGNKYEVDSARVRYVHIHKVVS